MNTTTDAPRMMGATPKLRDLHDFQPNDWNPNELTPREYESLKHGLLDEGWVWSQPLLVWGTDEAGATKNLIIDGEHRWRAGKEVGFKRAPTVILNGITRAQAMALTVKLDQRRGKKFKDEPLALVLRELQDTPEFQDVDLALDLGFEDEEFFRLMQEQEVALEDDSPHPGKPQLRPDIKSKNVMVKMVPLYVHQDQHAQLLEDLTALQRRYETETISDTVLRAILEAVGR